jgi:hypothetical protein
MTSRAKGMAMPRGALVPLLCVVHCLATPLLVLVAPMVAESKPLEWAGLVLAAGVCAYTVTAGVRSHGQRIVWVPVAFGLLIWTIGLLGGAPAGAEWLTTLVGAGAVAGGLVWEARIRHRDECGACRATAAQRH